MPGSGQWVELSESSAPPDYLENWVDNKHAYCLVFWSKNYGRREIDLSSFSQDDLSSLASILKKPDFEKIKQTQLSFKNKQPPIPIMSQGVVMMRREEYERPPVIAGSFTHWRFQPMFRVEDLIKELDPKYKDPMSYLRENGLLRKEVKAIEQMNKQEFG